MKVMIQSAEGRFYWGSNAHWVERMDQARVFPNSAAAVEYCLRQDLPEWVVLWKFENDRYDFRVQWQQAPRRETGLAE
jgi:hypothetical protein